MIKQKMLLTRTPTTRRTLVLAAPSVARSGMSLEFAQCRVPTMEKEKAKASMVLLAKARANSGKEKEKAKERKDFVLGVDLLAKVKAMVEVSMMTMSMRTDGGYWSNDYFISGQERALLQLHHARTGLQVDMEQKTPSSSLSRTTTNPPIKKAYDEVFSFGKKITTAASSSEEKNETSTKVNKTLNFPVIHEQSTVYHQVRGQKETRSTCGSRSRSWHRWF